MCVSWTVCIQYEGDDENNNKCSYLPCVSKEMFYAPLRGWWPHFQALTTRTCNKPALNGAIESTCHPQQQQLPPFCYPKPLLTHPPTMPMCIYGREVQFCSLHPIIIYDTVPCCISSCVRLYSEGNSDANLPHLPP